MPLTNFCEGTSSTRLYPSMEIPLVVLAGFLKILQKLCREVKPDKVVICWDGKGGSRKRKLVNKNYKEGRKPLRLNRDIRTLTAEEELQNKIWQQMRLMEYLNNFPVTQLVFDEVEADDVISFVAQMPDFKGMAESHCLKR